MQLVHKILITKFQAKKFANKLHSQRLVSHAENPIFDKIFTRFYLLNTTICELLQSAQLFVQSLFKYRKIEEMED